MNIFLVVKTKGYSWQFITFVFVWKRKFHAIGCFKVRRCFVHLAINIKPHIFAKIAEFFWALVWNHLVAKVNIGINVFKIGKGCRNKNIKNQFFYKVLIVKTPIFLFKAMKMFCVWQIGVKLSCKFLNWGNFQNWKKPRNFFLVSVVCQKLHIKFPRRINVGRFQFNTAFFGFF